MKYKTINGWTKESMKAAIAKGNKGKRAYDEEYGCLYLTEDGNKCAIGCFIPDGHKAQRDSVTASLLTLKFPDLDRTMPIEGEGLSRLQLIHDSAPSLSDPRSALYAWIDKNVEDA